MPTLSSRRAFTLVELLIVISIIGILAGMVVAVAAVAAQTGRVSKTRNIVGRINTLLMEHYNSYRDRRVEISPAVEAAIAANMSWSSADKGKARAAARLYALRELLIMEVPDRWSDLLLTDVPPNPSSGMPYHQAPLFLDVSQSTNSRTALAANFLRRYYQAASSAANREQLLTNQSAECLYLIVTVACGDGEARTLFHEIDIGDTDGDGAREFLDGWGKPINFLRWAPGYTSQVQGNANSTDYLADPVAVATADHDPFDVFRVQPNAFRLLPVVYSNGGDENPGVYDAGPNYVAWRAVRTTILPTSTAFPFFNRWLDPYVKVPSNSDAYLGTALAEGSTDNIHNHSMGDRLRAQR